MMWLVWVAAVGGAIVGASAVGWAWVEWYHRRFDRVAVETQEWAYAECRAWALSEALSPAVQVVSEFGEPGHLGVVSPFVPPRRFRSPTETQVLSALESDARPIEVQAVPS